MYKQWFNDAPKPLDSEISSSIKFRQIMHQYPELSWKEDRTIEMLRNFLVESSIAIECDSEAGLLARISHPNPICSIILRAELDAIEVLECSDYKYNSKIDGIMHACGHDVHTAIVLTIAQWISRTQLPIDLRCIFQRSEENWPSGASTFAKLIQKPTIPSFIIAFHVSPEHKLGSVVLRRGNAVAAVSCFRVEITGKPSHAAQPHQGVDAIATASNAISLFYSLLSRRVPPGTTVLSNIGTICGGTRENILANHVTFTGTCRGETDAALDIVKRILDEALKSTCLAYGATYNIYTTCSYPAVENGRQLSSAVKSAYSKRQDSLIQIDKCSMGGDDIGFLKDNADELCYLFFGTKEHGQKSGPLHSSNICISDAAIEVIASELMDILAELVDSLLYRDLE